LKKGIDRDVAIRQTFSELTFPVWLTIFTTSIGFLSLYFTSIPALKYFGL
jgi:predicted RND superfamily exporter protein